MKLAIIALALTLSTAAMAKTTATAALSNLLATGEYVGSNESANCTVKVIIKESTANIVITNQNSSASFALVDSSLNYSVNETNNAIAATKSLNAPFYLNGGTLILNIKPSADLINFSIATIALDHKGNDFSKYSTCSILR